MEQVKWIDINWNFYFDINFMPLLLTRLQGTPARMKDFTNSLSHEQLTFKPGGAWSIQQHLGHLSFVDNIHIPRLDDFRNHAEQLRGIDLSKEEQMMENYNSVDLKDVLNEFDSRRKMLVEKYKNFSDDELKIECIHPRYKRLFRTVDYAYSSSTHDDYHLAKVLTIRDRFKI